MSLNTMPTVTSPTLQTQRLNLRQWRLADFEPLSDFLIRDELNKYRGGGLSRGEAWEFLSARAGDWQIRGYGCFVIEEKKSGAAAGFCGLWHPFDLDEPELAWSLYPKFHRKGYAVEAATAVKVWAHETLKLPPLMSFVHPDNAPSIALAERLGAAIEELTTFGGEPRYRYRHVLPGTQPNNGERANAAAATNSQFNESTNQSLK